jgi:hypothetical protein
MGSRTHVQPIGQQIGMLGRRTLSGVLAIQAQANADNRPAIYVQNLGGGLHLVRNQCNDTPYKVSAVSPLLSFAPGQVVTLGSHRGMPGEVILGAASGILGSDTVNVDIAVIPAPFRSPGIASCPVPIRGKSYLALGSIGSGGGGTAFASIYHDGAVGPRLPDLAWTVQPDVRTAQRVSPLGDVVIAHGDGDGGSTVNLLTWHVTTGALDTLELTGVPGGFLDGPVWAGPLDSGACYALEGEVFGDRHLELQLYRLPVGHNESRPLSDFAFGPRLSDAGPWSTNVETGFGLYIIPSGPDLQVMAKRHDTGRNALVDFALSSRAWRINLDRVAPDSAAGDGRPMSNTRGLMPTQGTQLAVVPAWPASPSFNLLPDDWSLSAPPYFSISPDLRELALYPFYSGPDTHRLLRMPAAPFTIPTGCPIPAFAVAAAPWGSAWEAGSEPGHRPDVMLARD